MVGWESGPGMVQMLELEEGEACYYKDDKSFNPDIALSYIGDKVESLLGHLQKDFEGGISAENLGAKFGGYGSFLPSHQRSPSIRSQSKSPHRIQNSSIPKSPNIPLPELPAPNTVTTRDAPSTQKNDLIREKESVSFDKVPESFPRKAGVVSSKLDDPTKQRTLTVRIKVGSDRLAAQYNAEICNLGLITSPSSSSGKSPEGRDELQINSRETHDESPSKILQIMTSFPVSGGVLLSPLCEDLLNLGREPESSIVSFRNKDVIRVKKTHSAGKIENIKKSGKERMSDLNNSEQKNSGSDMNPRPSFDTVKEAVMPPDLKKRKWNNNNMVKEISVSDHLAKDRSFGLRPNQSCGNYEQPEPRLSSTQKVLEVSQKDVSVHQGQNSCTRDNQIYSGERVKKPIDKNLSSKVVRKAKSGDEEGLRLPLAVNKSTSEGDKKSKGSQSSRKLADTLRAPKDTEIAKKEDRIKSSKLSLERPKNYILGPVEKEKPSSKNRLKGGSSNRIEPIGEAIPFNGIEQKKEDIGLIDENWVACDLCGKWRLLPYCAKSEDLPDKWDCSMLDWLPGMNSCDISQDETSDAAHATYPVSVPVPAPVPEKENDFQPYADTNHNFSSEQMGYKLKKQKLKQRPTNTTISTSRPDKNGSYKEANQPLPGVKSSDRSNSQLLNKPTNAVSNSNKRKEEHVMEDDARKKRKESFEDLHGKSKKIKTNNFVNIDTCQNSGGNLSKIGRPSFSSGLPNKAALKEEKKLSVQNSSSKGSEKEPQLRKKVGETKSTKPVHTVTGKEPQLRKVRLKLPLTHEDINELRKDLEFEPISTAATSSSSKVSNSRKKRKYYLPNGSPDESVCSSPVRRVDLRVKICPGMDNGVKKCLDTNGCTELGVSQKGKDSVEKISTQKESRSGEKLSFERDKKGSSRAIEISGVGDKLKGVKDTTPFIECNQTGTHNLTSNHEVSLGNKNAALKVAEDALKKAEELKSHANLIKSSGFCSESNFESCRAAIKFLHGASLLEGSECDNIKHLEMNPLQIYITAAKLCENCASEYEKSFEMCAAALAYKCVEVSYMRIVYCKSRNSQRTWRDLQANLQTVPQGDSPSSSASDVDNLINLSAADKVNLCKGNDTHTGNHAILTGNRASIVRLLDFTKDVDYAMGAARKSQETFAAARVKLDDSWNKELFVSVKKVLDFGFQDVEEFIHLIQTAFKAINRQHSTGS